MAKVVERLEGEGRQAPPEIIKVRDSKEPLATVDPEAPNFSERKELSKLGTSCMSGVCKRQFVLDKDNLTYYD